MSEPQSHRGTEKFFFESPSRLRLSVKRKGGSGADGEEAGRMAGGAAGAAEDSLAALGGGAQLAMLQCALGTGFCPKRNVEKWNGPPSEMPDRD
jgi:hypothetical protein